MHCEFKMATASTSSSSARRARSLAGFALGLLYSVAVVAQPVHLISTALPTPVMGDGVSGDNFGIAVAVSGDTAVVGAYGDTQVAGGVTFGIAQGSAYVFERVAGAWVRTQKLAPQPIGEDGDNFGVSVAAVDDVIAIGAPRRNPDERFEAGTVFVYGCSLEGFLLRQVLVPGGADIGQRFGTAIAAWQDQLAIGVPAVGGGRVDLYQRDGDGLYQFQRSLVPLVADGTARFGFALAMADSRLLIGAPSAGDAGAIYHSQFDVGGWSDASRLPLVSTTGDELGSALALADSLALIGAPGAGVGEVRVLTHGAGDWTQVGVVSTAGVVGDRFGSALALDAGRAVIAAIGALGGDGRVDVYARTGNSFSVLDQLDIADGGTANRFGASLALGADGVLIGADLDRVGPNRGQGSVRWYQPARAGYAQTAQLDSGDGAIYDRYGTSVAVDGDVALVGAYLEDTDAGPDAGAAHWFERVGGDWQYRGRIVAPDAEIEDRFGIAVDVDGERMAIGAFWDVVGTNVDQGSVYIYRRDGAEWVFEAKLIASDGRPRDYFGFALSLDGDQVLVGARGASVPFSEQGVAYVYVRNAEGWQEQARLDSPVASSQGYFGASVALVGARALIGAPGVTPSSGPTAAGAAYVYERRGAQWTLASALQAPLPQSNAAYGFAVAADASRLLVGAFQDGFAGQGAAYIYRAIDRVLDGELRAAVPQSGEALGISVALSGNSAVLGAPGHDLGPLTSVGVARVFERGEQGWAESASWYAGDGAAGDAFGRALAMDTRHAVIGAPARGVDNPLEGHAYVTLIERLFADGFE